MPKGPKNIFKRKAVI